jgi:hypothetical protein
MTSSEEPPRRLIESEGRAGELLRRALSEEPRVGDPPRFARLQEKRAARARRQGVLVLAAAALAVVVGFRATRRAEPVVSVRAEPVVATVVTGSSASARDVEQPAQALPSESRHLAPRDSATKPRSGAPSVSRARAGEPAPASSSTAVAAEVAPSAKPCAELARNGAVDDAMSCYDKLATGAGVTAELAVFEQARLAGKALRQPARALALLEQYRERFPRGSLRAEVMLARIEWLLASGDTARTRAAVDEALASGLLKERREELTRLRASLDAAPRPQ